MTLESRNTQKSLRIIKIFESGNIANFSIGTRLFAVDGLF